MKRGKWLRLLLIWSLVHFALSMLSGIIGFGADFDQLRSRSAASRTAANVHDVLMGPHGAVIRSIPNRALVRSARWLVPTWLLLHSVLWGALAVIATEVLKRRRVQRAQGG